MSMLKFAVVAAAIAGGAVEARKASRGSLRASKSAPLRSSSGTCSGTTYDFFMLVTQWGITECMDVYSCNTNAQYATLHGLWPSRLTSEDYPCNCNDTPFNLNNISSLMTEMDQYWPSLNGANSDFWSHEYTKHGTCASDILPTEQKYFGAALNLRQQYDVISALSAQNIVPSNTDGFSMTQLKSAMTSAYGSGMDIAVSCDSKGNIQEMTSCFDLNLNPIGCPSYVDGPCSASTLYLPSSIE